MRKLVVAVCLAGVVGLGGYLSHRVLFPSSPEEKDDGKPEKPRPSGPISRPTPTPTLTPPTAVDEPALRLPTGEDRNLLRLPGIRLAWTTATGPERLALALLTDNDLNTTAVLSSSVPAPLEVAYTLPPAADGV